MNDNRKFIYIGILVIFIPIIALRMFSAEIQETQTSLYKKVDAELKKENHNLNGLSYDILSTEKKEEHYVVVTDMDTIDEKVFLVNDKAIDVTKEFQKTDKLLLSNAQGAEIKKIYSSLKNITDTDYPIDIYKKMQVARIHKSFKTKANTDRIRMSTYNFLYETEYTKEMIRNKSIIYINEKEVLNEVRDYEEIVAFTKKAKIRYPESIIAFMKLNDKQVLVYYDTSSKDIEYIEIANKKVKSNELNKNTANKLNSYLK